MIARTLLVFLSLIFLSASAWANPPCPKNMAGYCVEHWCLTCNISSEYGPDGIPGYTFFDKLEEDARGCSSVSTALPPCPDPVFGDPNYPTYEQLLAGAQPIPTPAFPGTQPGTGLIPADQLALGPNVDFLLTPEEAAFVCGSDMVTEVTPGCGGADLNGDGIVNYHDFWGLIEFWGQTCQ